MKNGTSDTTSHTKPIGHNLKAHKSEPVICKRFGCGKRLSLIEQLAGDKCTGCSNRKMIDVTKHLSFPSK